MYLKGKCQFHGASVDTFINKYNAYKYPDDVSDETKTALLEQIKQNPSDQTLKELMFNYHVRIIIGIVGKYIKRLGHKQLSDDLLEEASLATVLAINKFISVCIDDNITAYIVSHVHTRLCNFLRKERYRSRPLRTDNNLSLNKYPQPYRGNRVEDNEIITKIYNRLNRFKQEQQVFTLRLEGYNDVEIASMLGLSKAWVGQIRKRIKRQAKLLLAKYQPE